MNKRLVWAVVAGAMLAGACSGGSDDALDDPTTDVDTQEPAEAAGDETAEDAALENAEEFASDIADDLEERQESEGGGSATLTVAGETWEFPSVLCAFGEDEIGQTGGVFNLSAIADGVQLYVSIDDSGDSHNLSLNDIEDFANPSVSLSINKFTAPAVGAEPDFLTLDGKTVTADVGMFDDTTGAPVDGSAQLSASCP